MGPHLVHRLMLNAITAKIQNLSVYAFYGTKDQKSLIKSRSSWPHTKLYAYHSHHGNGDLLEQNGYFGF